MSFKHSIIVTGGTTGLGYQAALSIARKHPDYLVVISSRSDKEDAARTINETLRQTNTKFMPIDLSRTQNVRLYAEQWSVASYPPIAALVLNAGLQFPQSLLKNEEGLELTFAVNHVGHALLFHLLASHLSTEARIVVTASDVHDPAQKTGMPDAIYTTAEELAHPFSTANKPGTFRYVTSKLANVLWTYSLHRRLRLAVPEKRLTVTAFDPGLMPGTGLAREHNRVVRLVWSSVLPRMLPVLRLIMSNNTHTTKESGEALARLAVGSDVKGVSGKYFEGKKEIKSSEDSYDTRKQDDLWEWTTRFIARGDTELARFQQLK